MREADPWGVEGLFAVVDAQTMTKEAEFVYFEMIRSGPGRCC